MSGVGIKYGYEDHELPCDCFRRYSLDDCPCPCHFRRQSDEELEGHR